MTEIALGAFVLSGFWLPVQLAQQTKSRVVQAAIREYKVHPTYSPNLAQRDNPKGLLSVSKFNVPLACNEISEQC